MRQITFEIPEEVAQQFDREVPATEQCRVLAKLLEQYVSKPTWPEWTEEEWRAVNEFDDAADDAWLMEMARGTPMEEQVRSSLSVTRAK